MPRGWTQIASQIIKTGKILSIDIKEMAPIKNVKFFQGDISDNQTKTKVNEYFNSKLDVILSDMAADTTGNKSLILLELTSYAQKL